MRFITTLFFSFFISIYLSVCPYIYIYIYIYISLSLSLSSLALALAFSLSLALSCSRSFALSISLSFSLSRSPRFRSGSRSLALLLYIYIYIYTWHQKICINMMYKPGAFEWYIKLLNCIMICALSSNGPKPFSPYLLWLTHMWYIHNKTLQGATLTQHFYSS